MTEIDLQAVRCHTVRSRQRHGLECDWFGREDCVGHPAVVQRAPPEHFKIRGVVLFLPIAADEIVSRCFRLSQQQRDELINALTVVQRRNQWLDYADSSVIRASISP